jgi:hypothetical protein
MIRVIGLKHVMMNYRMRLKRIAKFPQGFVHQKLVNRPFKKRAENNANNKTSDDPEKK